MMNYSVQNSHFDAVWLWKASSQIVLHRAPKFARTRNAYRHVRVHESRKATVHRSVGFAILVVCRNSVLPTFYPTFVKNNAHWYTVFYVLHLD